MLRHPARFENAWPFHISSASLFFVEIVYSQATKKMHSNLFVHIRIAMEILAHGLIFPLPLITHYPVLIAAIDTSLAY